MDRKELILGTISDLVQSFLEYDRRNDIQLPPGAIGEAVQSGEITVVAMVHEFRLALEDALSISSRQTIPGSLRSTIVASIASSGASPERASGHADEPDDHHAQGNDMPEITDQEMITILREINPVLGDVVKRLLAEKDKQIEELGYQIVALHNQLGDGG